jgi:hypothetical protein
MKRLSVLSLLLLISLLLFLSSCIYENKSEPQPTQRGKAMYDRWHAQMYSVLERNVLTALHFSYYLDTEDSKKIAVEDSLFPMFKIRDLSNNAWGLYSEATKIYEIQTSNKSLYEVGAEWTLKLIGSNPNHPISSVSELAYTLTCIADSTWTITAVGDGNPFCYVSLQLQQRGSKVFEVSGEGRFGIRSGDSYYYGEEISSSDNAIVFLSFTLEETAKTRTNFQRWTHGKVSLRAYNIEGDERVTQVQMLNPNAEIYAVRVNYKGLSELWSLQQNYYYY